MTSRPWVVCWEEQVFRWILVESTMQVIPPFIFDFLINTGILALKTRWRSWLQELSRMLIYNHELWTGVNYLSTISSPSHVSKSITIRPGEDGCPFFYLSLPRPSPLLSHRQNRMYNGLKMTSTLWIRYVHV